MGLFVRTLLVIVGCLAVLGGVQVPGFVDQYVKRVDARLAEARLNFEPFAALARRRHQGSIDALIAHHEASSDATFQDEAQVIRGLRGRVQYLERHAAGLDAPLHRQLVYLATDSDSQLVGETREHYSHTVQLDRTALISGAVALLAVILPLELFGGLFRSFGPGRKRYSH